MLTLSKPELIKKLHEIAELPWDCIQAEVAKEALDNHDPESFFTDLAHHGCQSGLVGSLVYYCDTHAFFDRHYSEIENLRLDWGDNIGEPLKISGDLKNHLAWFAFEYVAHQVVQELGLEL